MTHHFNKVGWPAGCPEGEGERKAVVADLHKRKTALFMQLVDTGALPLRPGVARWILLPPDSQHNTFATR